MASSSFMRSLLLFHLFFFFSLLYPLSSTAQLYKLTTGLGSKLLSHPKPLKNPSPTRFFEVTKPPPVIVPYSPPSHCPSQNFSKIVLKWTATCKGRQFDRIFGVWLDGVELLRSCTAEPKATGIVWTVEKDITRSLPCESLFHFYPADDSNFLKSGYEPDSCGGKEFIIPKNAYRAVLEVYVSFHENDEFWYLNPPNDYIDVNNLTGSIPGNSAFREVLVSLDGELVGAVWPFTVIHTGGVNPLLWRPISAIGSFNLPSYDIEITPFLGNLLDGKSHGLGFSVTNALNVYILPWMGQVLPWEDDNKDNPRFQLYEQDGYLKNGNLQIVNQRIQVTNDLHSTLPPSSTYVVKSTKPFP
ncbi:Peptide-N4-(N-acetyl-beta-glucosaminyl)asparagine amidase A [Vitis vinifera]|uniref:Peptide-N4-(N-acetyl-beta-glucosaminyl)asparagine amidase A n=1 Tax=Vitis vinifera TaxID=29760 RepID=A0A438J4P9_VITVI|nr:Peptide-N4-(N-acetyl-beta-glucosaminyl)asparagine amidase A [Vitis vinifera]